MPPVPVDAKFSLPGDALASAMNSADVFAGTVDATTAISGTRTTSPIGARSLVESYGTDFSRLALIASGPALPMPIV